MMTPSYMEWYRAAMANGGVVPAAGTPLQVVSQHEFAVPVVVPAVRGDQCDTMRSAKGHFQDLVLAEGHHAAGDGNELLLAAVATLATLVSTPREEVALGRG